MARFCGTDTCMNFVRQADVERMLILLDVEQPVLHAREASDVVDNTGQTR